MDGVGVLPLLSLVYVFFVSDVGRRSVTDSIARVAETPRRSRVRGSVVGPFSHVAILLSCVVSSEFKQTLTCFVPSSAKQQVL